MTRLTQGQISAERVDESERFLGTLADMLIDARWSDDHDTIAALHRALAGVMRRMQQREIDSQTDPDATLWTDAERR